MIHHSGPAAAMGRRYHQSASHSWLQNLNTLPPNKNIEKECPVCARGHGGEDQSATLRIASGLYSRWSTSL